MYFDANYGQPGAVLSPTLQADFFSPQASSQFVSSDPLKPIELHRTEENVAQCRGSINQYIDTLADTTGKSQEVYDLVGDFNGATTERSKLVVLSQLALAESRSDIFSCVSLVQAYASDPGSFTGPSSNSTGSTPSDESSPSDPTECEEGWEWSPEDNACISYEGETWWYDLWNNEEKKYHRWAIYGTGAVAGFLFFRWVWGKPA